MSPKVRPESESLPLGGAARSVEGAPSSVRDGQDAAIDIVIPVYNAAADLVRCVDSVLQHTVGRHRLVLIDDASPDPAIGRYFQELAARTLPHVLLLRNPVNLGFTGTANRGMQLSRADVVLLNSDTVVTRGWLDAIRRCAASNPSIGTITPFSNNAEICSYPRFCVDNPWPDGADPEPVRAAMARTAVPTYPDLPTGVGFCMYVRRALIDAIGVFDPAFGLGYGEENDFCLRGFAVGYRNVLCDDAFVLHLGQRSFEGRKEQLGVRNLALLVRRHPHYEAMVRDYIAADPLRPIRDAAQASERAHVPGTLGVLHIIHGRGGGTEHHARALIAASPPGHRHYLVEAAGSRWQFEDHASGALSLRFELGLEAGESWADLLRAFCASFRVDLVHVHHIAGARDALLEALPDLGVPYGCTVHDLHFACPPITFLDRNDTYCGGETDVLRCTDCLDGRPEFSGVDIASWRARHARLLDHAAFIIAPSAWAANELLRYFPGHRVDVIAHGGPVGRAASSVLALVPVAAARGPRMAIILPDDRLPTVAIIGAIGPDKGARRLERLVELARESGAPLRFVLIGYLDREQGPWQSADARFTIHGRYAPHDLPDLLAHYRAELVVFPSAGPESFSFTLSEAWASGRPVMVPPIGALAERVRSTGAGWVWTEDEWAGEAAMLRSIVARLVDKSALTKCAERAASLPQRSHAEMAADSVRIYGRVDRSGRAATIGKPLAPRRLRDALGYELWYPPRQSARTPPLRANGDVAGAGDAGRSPIAALAFRFGATPLGVRLRAWMPASLREALKARLRP